MMTLYAGRANGALKRFRIALTERIARIVVRLVPRARSYDALILIVRLVSGIANAASRLTRGRAVSSMYSAQLLRDMLGEATVCGGVNVRMAVQGDDTIEILKHRHGGRFVLFTAHFFLSMAIPEVLARHGLKPVLITGYAGDADRLNWFGRVRPPELIAENALCLVKARKALAAGQPVSLCPDTATPIAHAPGCYEVVINPNTFHFAEHADAGALFAATTLSPDGTILVEFALPAEDAAARGAEGLCEAYRDFLEPRLERPCRILERHEQTDAAPASDKAA